MGTESSSPQQRTQAHDSPLGLDFDNEPESLAELLEGILAVPE